MVRYDKEYDPDDPDEVIVIHFLPDLISSLLILPENKSLALLLEKASYGHTLEEATKLIRAIRFSRNTEKFILLLQLLNLLASSKDNSLISHTAFSDVFHQSDDTRLNRVFHFTLNNFGRTITLKEVADLVHLCPHSFCRYFRSRTKKRYSTFLLEVRVSNACKLLTETDLSIAVISYESGFMNFSNFNRHFKMITGKTPLEYKKQFREMKHVEH